MSTQLACPKCSRVLEFSGDRPSFCAFCGHSLTETLVEPTAPFYEAATLAPTAPARATTGGIPETIGGYRLLRPLGRGGMGSVYEAEEITSGRHVALKLIPPEFAASPATVERFRQEGRLASTLVHPRCVFVLAADEDAGRPYIVMELMPGSTLNDLVGKGKPLPPAEAIAKILDVIDGLQEAHRVGIIHRDVKPGNCFLEPDGRVKIGDFGLAKSLEADTHLTKTGSFLGTVLFASPEQIRKDPADEQTDVYSVAATLYFLLTGQAPFQGGDASATLARIVADPVPSMRTLRPEIPAALDQVVLRGLERQRERRWRGMDEFRDALLPFVPGHLSVAGLGPRFTAYLIDYIVMTSMGALLGLAIIASGWGSQKKMAEMGLRLETQLFSALPWIVCLFAAEALFGCSFGKWLLGLRVCGDSGVNRAAWPRVLLRFVIFYGLLQCGTLTLTCWLYIRGGSAALAPKHMAQEGALLSAGLPLGGFIVGLIALLVPMRARNGYRGLHELLSGTRVLRQPGTSARRRLGRVSEFSLVHLPDMPQSIGTYAVTGAVVWSDRHKLLLGEDRRLVRKAWIWLRPLSEAALPEARRTTSRTSRPRWLASGTLPEHQWDAFVFRAGCCLPELVAADGRLPWSEARPCLEQLAEEVSASLEEGTLPAGLHLDQVLIQPNGGTQLLDFVPHTVELPGAPPEAVLTPDEKARGLAIVRKATILMLEGTAEAGSRPDEPIRAPLPRTAARVVDDLLKSPDNAAELARFQEGLQAAATQPAEVDRRRRLIHLFVLTAFVACGLACMATSIWLVQFCDALTMSLWVWEADGVLPAQDQRVFADAALAGTAPTFPTPVFNVLQLENAIADRDRLRADYARIKSRLEARRSALSAYTRSAVQFTATGAEQIRSNARAGKHVDVQIGPLPSDEAEAPPPLSKKIAAEVIGDEADLTNVGRQLSWLLKRIILCWGALWVVWAFLFRGGISYRLAGIALVRGNGRPALRVLCAWRSLLVWAPLCLLFVTALWADDAIWTHWSAGASPGWWRLWLPELLWWSGILLLGSYVALAMWRPARCVHDRLSGVYLVPR